MEAYEIPVDVRQREQFLDFGLTHISDRELVSILLCTAGTRNNALAGRVLSLLDSKNYQVNTNDLQVIPGLGKDKAAMIIAALELGRRTFGGGEKQKIRTCSDVLEQIRHYADREQECFIALSINGAAEIKAVRVISVGLVNKTLVHPREVFAGAITDKAAAIICAHNHPSGNTEPSPEDRKITLTLRKSGKLLGIPMLDHIIFSRKGYYSFHENDKR